MLTAACPEKSSPRDPTYTLTSEIRMLLTATFCKSMFTLQYRKDIFSEQYFVKKFGQDLPRQEHSELLGLFKAYNSAGMCHFIALSRGPVFFPNTLQCARKSTFFLCESHGEMYAVAHEQCT